MTMRKNMILESATRLFAERGYDATPVAEIARAAGVSEGAIFRHFKTKEDLLLEAFRLIRERFTAFLEKERALLNGTRGLEQALSLCRVFCDFFVEHELDFDNIHRNNPYQMPGIGEPCRIEMQRIHDMMLDQIELVLSAGQSDGSIRQCPSRETSILVLGMIIGTVRLRIFHPEIHLRTLEVNLLIFLDKALNSA